LLFALALLVTWSCHSRKVAIPPPAPTNPEPAKIEPAPTAITPVTITPSQPVPLPKTTTRTSDFDLGEIYFQNGKYDRAASHFEAFLKADPKSKNRDRALYYLGLARALISDSGRAETAFKKLISEFPKSQYKKSAEYILLLEAQIEKLKAEAKDQDDKVKRLSEELQKLKDIDMQRRPSRTE
jgi:TolA-binding protein